MADMLGQQDCPIIVDQAIYCKALEIVWANPQQFKEIVLCLGPFHIACTFLAVIGKRYGNAGLADILVESGVLGSGSIAGVLEGKHHNRAMRIHKLVAEGLEWLQWQSFGRWLKDQGESLNYEALATALTSIHTNVSESSLSELLINEEFLALVERYKTYAAVEAGPMNTFWTEYLNMVALVWTFTRAVHEGDWQLHLATIRDMIPYIFPYDHVNYSCYLPI